MARDRDGRGRSIHAIRKARHSRRIGKVKLTKTVDPPGIDRLTSTERAILRILRKSDPDYGLLSFVIVQLRAEARNYVDEDVETDDDITARDLERAAIRYARELLEPYRETVKPSVRKGLQFACDWLDAQARSKT